MRGRRTTMSSASRYIAWSVPAEGSPTMGRSAHCGNCAAINLATSAVSMSSSSECIFSPRIVIFRRSNDGDSFAVSNPTRPESGASSSNQPSSSVGGLDRAYAITAASHRACESLPHGHRWSPSEGGLCRSVSEASLRRPGEAQAVRSLRGRSVAYELTCNGPGHHRSGLEHRARHR
jgi:hypothetical protein